jgi:putative ABC transport system ATP-binding protein
VLEEIPLEETPVQLLEARDVTKTFVTGKVAVHAIRNVNLFVQQGEFASIVGPSGCGKSTLLHLLGGLEQPTSGQVLLNGASLGQQDDFHRTLRRRREVGFVFQKLNLLPMLSAVENVALPLRLDRMPRRSALELAHQALKQVAMQHRANHQPAELSGGEAQRVAIARALVIEPQVILADEPTGALDSQMGEQIVCLFRQLVESSSQTIVVVTHDLSLAAAADRTIHMKDGQIVDPLYDTAESIEVVT